MYAVLKEHADVSNPGTNVNLILPTEKCLSRSTSLITEIDFAFDLKINCSVKL